MHRRHFLATLAAASTPLSLRAQTGGSPLPIKLALKCGMAQFGANLEEKFRILKELGYDGVELDSPGGQDKEEALAASKSSGLPIHGVVDSIHWKTRLSDPDAAVREEGLKGLLTAIRESHACGGSTVLLVPGVVDAKTNHDDACSRSIEQIRKALPLAAELGVHILIENVWNKMFYTEDGGNAQSAEKLAAYLDEIDSPWVGSYFDIGNHHCFGQNLQIDPQSFARPRGRRLKPNRARTSSGSHCERLGRTSARNSAPIVHKHDPQLGGRQLPAPRPDLQEACAASRSGGYSAELQPRRAPRQLPANVRTSRQGGRSARRSRSLQLVELGACGLSDLASLPRAHRAILGIAVRQRLLVPAFSLLPHQHVP